MSADVGDSCIFHGWADVGSIGGYFLTVVQRSVFGEILELSEKS
jgi:hypothetical protein